MGQRRRRDATSNAGGRRQQQLSAIPGDLSKKAILRYLMRAAGAGFSVSEVMVADLQTPKSLATVLDLWETNIAGLGADVQTHVLDLSGAGFTASAAFAEDTILYAVIDDNAGTVHTVTITAADVFSVASVGPATMTLNAGACTITRSTGALSIVTQAPTTTTVTGTWELIAFVIEGTRAVTGAGPHGGGWGAAANYLPRNGVVEIRHTPVAAAADVSILLQSLPHPGAPAATFANTNFQTAWLLSPFVHMKDNVTLYWHAGNDPKLVLTPGDAGWTAFLWDDVTDLAEDSILYTTRDVGGVGAGVFILSFRVDLEHPVTRTESTFLYGFAAGVK